MAVAISRVTMRKRRKTKPVPAKSGRCKRWCGGPAESAVKALPFATEDCRSERYQFNVSQKALIRMTDGNIIR